MTRQAVAALLHSLEFDDSHLAIRYSDTTAKVSGPSRFVEAVADAIGNAQRQTVVDPPVDQIEIRVFPLRYAQAQDITYRSGNRDQVVPGVASLLRKLIGDATVPAREQPVKPRNEARPGRGGPPPLPSLRGLGLADTGLPVEPLPVPGADSTQFAAISVHRNIIADPRSNSVVIYDVPSMMPNYERVIAMLDQPQDLVEITAAVIDVTSDAAQELGIRWGGGVAGRDGSAYAAMNGASSGAAALMPGMNGTVSGLNLATLIGNSANFLFARIHALEGSGKARILSQPQVLTLNNAEAVLTSHKSMYVRVAGNQDVDLFNVDTGLTLKVTPTVEPDGPRNILLSVQIEDGAFDTGTTVDGIPKVSNHSIITQAVVGEGESLLIGGYE
jgi:type III secretion protein C